MIFSPIAGVNRITQVFGARPEVYAQFGLKGHNGIDLTPRFKSKMAVLHSPIDGRVTVVQDDGKSGYGKWVRIVSAGADDKGRLKEITIAHLSEFRVSVGQYVYQLDEIGVEGNTGFSTAPHVHLGLRYLDAATGAVLDTGNGYKGSVDFLPYLRFWTQPDERQAYGIMV
jgi:murein DD-endopeptidase MepM/ murein hydrolase activator NlpD